MIGCCALSFAQQDGNPWLRQGWSQLIKDNDTEAFRLFNKALDQAVAARNRQAKAEALLYLGICSYGSSLDKGLEYATRSVNEFAKLEKSRPGLAMSGRGRCFQLIATIYARQGKKERAAHLSHEAIKLLANQKDSTATKGLAYSLLGKMLEEKHPDSTAFFYALALEEFQKVNKEAYLPTAYLRIGGLAKKQNDKQGSLGYFRKAYQLAVRTRNVQALVSSLIALGRWEMAFGDTSKAVGFLTEAYNKSKDLSDKTFEISVLDELIAIKEQQRKHEEVIVLQQTLMGVKEQNFSIEKEHITKRLEVEFEVVEKDRKLALLSKEKEIAKLTNTLLIIGIAAILLISVIFFVYRMRISSKNAQLSEAQEALLRASKLQLRNDLEHKESQLTAITLQMQQKNELLEELKSAIEKNEPLPEAKLRNLVNKYFTHGNNWSDFDMYFEGINKNFYQRLKHNYPDISGNDLKICALIRLNLTVKEMSSVLNISPDSVKTARYRLRKKLQLATEDNLNGFIMGL